MDRHIKFRVRDLEKKIMFIGEDFCFYNKKDNHGAIGEVFMPNAREGSLFIGGDFEQCKIMQRTGLKDSKGKDIYENDITNNGIVKRFDGLHWDGGGSIHPGRYFDLSYNKDQELQYHTGFDDVIILGNIYENPDLIPKPTNG